MHTRTATRTQRALATAINLLIGLLPISIPNLIFVHSPSRAGWAQSESSFYLVSAVLFLLQFLFVHRMQGSPGYVFAGLRVQYVDGTPPNIKTTFLRATPYLIIVTLRLLILGQRSDPALVEVYSACLLAAIGFIAASGFTALFTNGHSLMDRITGTETVKAYSVGFHR